MKKTFSATMIIIGTVIGSGFASGKEIAVFFSRFGRISYFFIGLTFFLFWGVIYFFLSHGGRALKKISSSSTFGILTVIVALIFTSSMFAGVVKVLPESLPTRVASVAIVLCACFFVVKNGLPSLTSLNNLLIPLTLLSMCISLGTNFEIPSSSLSSQNAFAGLLFMLLYVVLNFSISSVVIASSGQELTKRQRVISSGVSSFILCLFLLLTNFVLLSHPQAMEQEMPLLYLSSGLISLIVRFVIFSGCTTTLFSLVYTSCESLKKVGASRVVATIIAVILPFAFSFLGFGAIVSYLYPFASIIGTILLILMIAVP